MSVALLSELAKRQGVALLDLFRAAGVGAELPVDAVIARCARLPLALSIVAARAAANPRGMQGYAVGR